MDEMNVLQLPDEAEYPSELTKSWELLERLSANHEAETLMARHRETGKKAAVKCYRAEHPLFAQSVPDSLRKLDAPPMPRYLGEYTNGQMRCVLWEYVEGENLAKAVKGRPFSPEEITDIGIALCRQLEMLQEADPPIIHRDVKPQNIIMREDGSPVLIDFEIARVSTEKKKADTLILGTKGFAPPEQYGFARTDARSDIYSLGVVLNWMRNGETEVPKEAKTPLDKVIQRMTAFDPTRRYADAQAAEKALRLSRTGNVRKRRTWGIAAATLALIGIILAAVFLTAPKRVKFSNPLIEEAVQKNLGLSEGAPVTAEDLPRVKGIYIVADEAYADADGFYAAVNRWYGEGRKTRGSVENLDDLSQMPEVEQVCIAAQRLKDINGLKGLTHLNKAEFKHNEIQDISVLAGLTGLTSVGLNDNPVRDLSPLTELPSLAYLDLCGVRNYDPKVISELGNFDYLDIANPTESYHYLGEKQIRSLSIAWSGLTTLEDLKGITRLEDLEIGHTNVTDLSPITRHVGLHRLRMASTPIKDLTPLLSLPMLESITLSKDMEPLLAPLGDISFSVEYE